MNEDKRKELEVKIDIILKIAIFAQECFELSNYLIKPNTDEELNYLSSDSNSSRIWRNIKNNQVKMAIIELAKLFSSKDNDKFNLYNFLKSLKSDGYYGDAGVSESIIEKWNNELLEYKVYTEKIIILRDKVYAHTDPKEPLVTDEELPFKKLGELINFVKQIIDEVSVIIFNTNVEYTPTFEGSKFDFIKILAREKKNWQNDLMKKFIESKSPKKNNDVKSKDKEALVDEIIQLGLECQAIDYEEDKRVARFWVLPKENKKLVNTPFYYKEEKDFIHFTTEEALYNILNTGEIRLYNLINMDDKLELDYAINELCLKTNKDKRDKKSIYSLSMCESSIVLNETSKTEQHLLWKLHGKDGHGVAVRLRFEDDLLSWKCYYLSKCFYDLNNFKAIKNLNEITKEEYISSDIAAFIKSPIYEFENEVRLLFYKHKESRIMQENENRNIELIYPKTYPDKYKKQNDISYYSLPLYNFYEKNKNIFNVYGEEKEYEIPKLTITEIILGYRYNDDDLKSMTNHINQIDSTIKVSISNLKSFY